MGEVTSWKSFLVVLGGANRGSAQRATGQGPLGPIQVKLIFSSEGEKKRI